jgi:hypothetical protein
MILSNYPPEIAEVTWTPAEREMIDKADRARHSIAESNKRRLPDWLDIAPLIKHLRIKATNMHTKQAFKWLMRKAGYPMGPKNQGCLFDEALASKLVTLYDQQGEVLKWYMNLTDGERSEWNHPSTIWKRCPAILKEGKEDKKGEKLSPYKKLEQANIQLQEENAELKRRLQQTDGSRFDLRRDTAQDIYNVMMGVRPRLVNDLVKLHRKKSMVPAG